MGEVGVGRLERAAGLTQGGGGHGLNGGIEQRAINAIDAAARDHSLGSVGSPTVEKKHRQTSMGEVHRVLFVNRKEWFSGAGGGGKNGVELCQLVGLGKKTQRLG